MKLAVVQMDACETDPVCRRQQMSEAAHKASGQGARVIVFPELALTGYGAGDQIAANAQGLDGVQVRFLKDLAAATGSALVAGLALRDGETLRNAAIFAAPDGTVAAYHKLHLYGGYEKALFTLGQERPPVIAFEGLNLGLLVCFDVEFPERVRDLALRGADAVLVPTALPQSAGGAFIAGSVLPVRAFENQVFVAYANHCGADARFSYQGRSCIAAPDGSFLAQASTTGAEVAVADIMVTAYDACRAQNPYLDEVRASSQ
ncbi:putative amidohydrolase [Roseibium hamelinense]|uniref:Putative amidohydrolase n=1 Tax=Roseibium hamelinense TaxID=150831 RepID=A0A562TGR6_9HYPH|nr:carbon-nitrogen hydrolase family protein [Roseibium hamelinense]TWI92513.1 putative amidohydrolase [Roseibium hamelinense]